MICAESGIGIASAVLRGARTPKPRATTSVSTPPMITAFMPQPIRAAPW